MEPEGILLADIRPLQYLLWGLGLRACGARVLERAMEKEGGCLECRLSDLVRCTLSPTPQPQEP